ncbi:MAG: hypothetical protein H6Q69_5025 [Firmicutes bacterium]|nr:hypothetical protein [Bacillota bacterium]
MAIDEYWERLFKRIREMPDEEFAEWVKKAENMPELFAVEQEATRNTKTD